MSKEEKNIKVSVIVPVYNSEQYLETCLKSLLFQTLRDIEVICVDDGSTDRSCEILNQYAEQDVRLRVLHQKNQYAGMARNNGLAVARGKYVCFLDSDDFFSLSLLEKTYSRGEETDADIVIFGAQRYDTVAKTAEKVSFYFDRRFLPDKEVFSYKDIPDRILMLTTPAPWTKLYRRDFVQQQGLQFQPLQNSNDAYFVLLSMCTARRIAYVDEELVYYRVGQKNNLQSLKNRYPVCFLEAYSALYEELQKRGLYAAVEKSYTDVVLSGCAYNLDTIADPQAKLKIFEALFHSSFLSSGILEHPDSYYLDKRQRDKVRKGLDLWRPYEEERQKCLACKEGFPALQAQENIPCVSVIIPVYNTELYIAACLESVCRQTLKNIEVIVVNDGTTDRSMIKVVAAAEKDSRIKVINKENGGLSSARNRGIKEAVGEYILFLDSDDMLSDLTLELLYYRAKSIDLEDLFFSAVSFQDDDCATENYLKYMDYYKRKADYPGVWKGTALFTAFVENNEFRPSACLQLLKRSFLIKNGISFFEGILHEDNLFTMQCLLKAERCAFLNLELYFRRLHEHSIMTRSKTMDHVYGYYISMAEMLKTLRLCYTDTDKAYAVALEKQFHIMMDITINTLRGFSREQIDTYREKLSTEDRILFDLLFMDRLNHTSKGYSNPFKRLLRLVHQRISK